MVRKPQRKSFTMQETDYYANQDCLRSPRPSPSPVTPPSIQRRSSNSPDSKGPQTSFAATAQLVMSAAPDDSYSVTALPGVEGRFDHAEFEVTTHWLFFAPEMIEAYHYKGFPATFLVGRDGKVAGTFFGLHAGRLDGAARGTRMFRNKQWKRITG